MKAKEIYASIKFTKNLGNFQSFVAEAGITADLEQGETVELAFEEAWAMAKEQVRMQIEGLKKEGN